MSGLDGPGFFMPKPIIPNSAWISWNCPIGTATGFAKYAPGSLLDQKTGAQQDIGPPDNSEKS